VAANRREKSSKISSAILDQDPAPQIIRAIETGLARFGQHKTIIIDQLSNSQHSKVENFDNEKWWGRLVRVAEIYFLEKARRPAAKRKTELLALAKLLDRACKLAENVRQDAIGLEMISLLFDGLLPRDPPVQITLDKNGSIRVAHLPNLDFKKLMEALSRYHAAVLRAAHYLPSPRSGTPPFLPSSFIRQLAAIYLESTERKAGAGDGPFVQFVTQFRAAVDPSFKPKAYVDQTVLDAVKDALRRPRSRSSARPKR
jgi:hypothetical protein